jgi:catalase
MLVTDGCDGALVAAARRRGKGRGSVQIVAPKIGGAAPRVGRASTLTTRLPAGRRCCSTPWLFFHPPDGAASLEHDAAAIDWIRDAYGHLKVIGAVSAADAMLTRAGADPDGGIVAINGPRGIAAFITARKTADLGRKHGSAPVTFVN